MDTSAIKQVIDEAITSNGSGEITGTVLNQVLNAMVDAMANVISGTSGNIAYSDGVGGLLSSKEFKYISGTLYVDKEVAVDKGNTILGGYVGNNRSSLTASDDIFVGSNKAPKGIFLYDEFGNRYYVHINRDGQLVAEQQLE